MIICFEGPSAVGKSTIAQSLSDPFHVVPEVNLLYERPAQPSLLWYYERQIDRLQSCMKSDQSSILDGDPFQPLWYNWIYGYPSSFPSQKETLEFYREAISKELLQFPDVYIVLQAELNQLISHKEQDHTRQRRNFEKHTKLIEPQEAYFTFLKDHTDINVFFITNSEIHSTSQEVLDTLHALKPQKINHQENFDRISDWLAG